MKPTEKQIEGLPKWAQAYIAKLERDIAHHEVEQAEIENHMTGVEWSVGLDATALPKHSTVWFGERPNRVSVSVTYEGAIRVSADNQLLIRPGAANVAEVESSPF